MTEHYYQRRPGDLIFNQSEIDLMPEGTKVMHGSTVHTKEAGGWRTPYSRNEAIAPSRHGETSLISYPEGFEYPHDTVEQYMWKVRDVTLAAAQRNSVSGVPQTLERLAVTADKFPIGRGMRVVHPGHLTDQSLLPVDSVVSTSHPDRDDFTLHRRDPNGWVRLYGPLASPGGGVIVEEVGGIGIQYDWLEEAGDASVDAAVNAFKVKAWREGVRSQSEYGWCGTFVTVMGNLGISAEVVAEIERGGATLPPVGRRVSWSEAATMPLGTMFTFTNGEGDVFWYQRSTASENRGGTMRVCGWTAAGTPVHDRGGHYASRSMRLLGGLGDEIPIPRDNMLARMRALPRGSEFRFLNGARARYILNGSGYFGTSGNPRQYRLSAYFADGMDNAAALIIRQVV